MKTNLIAAAQEMLEALEMFGLGYSDEDLKTLAAATDGMGEIGPFEAKREIARRAAIRKAKGESK